MDKYQKSNDAFIRAKRSLPGGVNSPVRAFKSVGGQPVFFSSGKGAWLTDIDGNRYLDFVGSWGPMLLGHTHPEVTNAIISAVKHGTSFGAPSEAETELAEHIMSLVPSVELVRLVNSGTEATMSAVRLARGVTKRDKIVKFEGCYHGHGDAFLIAAGSGALTLGVPDSPGVTSAVAKDTLIAKFNDVDSVTKLFEQSGRQIAVCIVEPIAGNMGVVPPAEGFLTFLREITNAYGALLIFDEVMTGFRVAPGGAQQLYNVNPDITTFGKIIGGGMPVGAFGGKKKIMEHIAPAGPVYQAGTLSGNPVTVAAGIAMLKEIKANPSLYADLERTSSLLAAGIEENCRSLDIPAVVNRVGSMLTVFFTGKKMVNCFKDAKTSDTKFFGRYFHASLDEGIYLPPSQFEAMFISAAHTDIDIEMAIVKNKIALAKAKG
jgi:glutamate-1-semialdehyde 2,1-aminomutase